MIDIFILYIDNQENDGKIVEKGDDFMEIGLYDTININEGNIIRLVESIFSQALQMHASDIHIEPLTDYCRVRVRLDGLLKELCRLPLNKLNPILSRIKLISDMDIAEKRLPQDGRIAVTYDTKAIDLRVASLPTIEGEKLAIRILDKGSNFLSLKQVGFSQDNLERFTKLITAPNGIILVTGPTGSGKTTTLYATLNEINDEDKNITTIEDPVEYKLAGINQISVNTKAGMDFSRGLRAIVRQDPNIVMIGEIRDSQTARTALQAALTGHLVFSTLHTNSALGSIDRLLNMDIEPFLLLSGLRGIVAQRLVRKLCPHCKSSYQPNLLERKCLALKEEDNISLFKPTGCPHCHNTGYQGRIAVHELLILDEHLERMLIKHDSKENIKKYLQEQGCKTLRADGISKVLQGITSIDELIRTSII